MSDCLEPLLLSVQQAAESLSISEWSIRHLLRTGQLARVRIGTRVLVSSAELARFVKDHTEAPGNGLQLGVLPNQ
jgi:excisionase family DNA binding protein